MQPCVQLHTSIHHTCTKWRAFCGRLCHDSLYFLEADLPTKPEAHFWVDYLTSHLQTDICLSLPCSKGVTGMHSHAQGLLVCWLKWVLEIQTQVPMNAQQALLSIKPF